MQVSEEGLELTQMLRGQVSSLISMPADAELDDDHELLQAGLLDSMGIMELVAYIEDTLGVVVEDEEIIAENFRSVALLTGYVAGKKGIEAPARSLDRYIEDVRELVRQATPPDATVLLLTNGDDKLLAIPDRCVWHFPREADGQYRRGKPIDGSEAIKSIDSLRCKGATHIVFPAPELWWLEYYSGLREYLESGTGQSAGSKNGTVYRLPGQKLEART